MIELQTDVQQRYQAALDALVAKLEQDRYVLAVVVYGSVVRGEAWEKSDIDLEIIVTDGSVRAMRGMLHYWLTEDGINISAAVVPRSAFKRFMDGALQGSMMHSIRSQCKLLFSKDESIVAWLQESDRVGTRDQEYQLLRKATTVLYDLAKAEKWFYVKEDVHYSFVWVLYTVNALAQVEVVLNGEAPSREVIHQALKHNPSFFNAVYTELIDGPKDRETIPKALDLLNAYLEQYAERLFKPLLTYLAEADGSRTISEINATFRKKVQRSDLLEVCEWLARKGIIEKVAAPVRLTRKSQVTLEEPAYYYDVDFYDWE
jgi:hypothetical protein